MRKLNDYKFLIGWILILFTASCADDDPIPEGEFYEVNQPIVMSIETLRQSVRITSPREMKESGKIYIYKNYIFVNEVREGIHVVDNSNPENPKVVTFIEVPGNIDVAVKNNILYADSYVDLVALDISNINAVKEVSRIKNAFENYFFPVIENDLFTDVGEVDYTNEIIVGWEVVKKEGKMPDIYYTTDMAAAEASAVRNSTGVGGSMSSFLLTGDVLYTIEGEYALQLFDVTEASNPIESGKYEVGWRIETLFAAGNNLFIGSQNGMFIYSISNPFQPVYISEFRHAFACDPVFVSDTIAYVTLRTENWCTNQFNELKVVNISDIENPTLLTTYDMYNPHGLSVWGNTLFLCDGDEGLKIFDISDLYKITSNQLAHYPDIDAFDVIARGNVLILIGTDGLYQFDFSDLENIQLLSSLIF